MTERTDQTVAGIMEQARKAELVYAAVVSSAQHEGTIAADIRTAYDNERIALETAVRRVVRERAELRWACEAAVRRHDREATANGFVPADRGAEIAWAMAGELRAALAAEPAGEDDR